MATLGLVSLFAWLYLLLGRGGFWLARERDDRDQAAPPAVWPSVVAGIPARAEADVIGRAAAPLVAQDDPGRLPLIIVDDQSADGTAARVAKAAKAAGASDRVDVQIG